MATVTPVDRLEPGDHACLTYSDHEERLDLLAAFVSAGLDRGDRVVCYTDDPVDLRERGAFDDVRVAPSAELWGDTGPDARTMVERLGDEVERALADGHPGLRVTTDMCWAARPQANAEQLLAFESKLASLFADGRLTVLCEYDRESFDPVTLAYAARVHSHTVAAAVYYEDPVLRICRQHLPPGVRVAGELDFSKAEALTDALAEAVRLDRDVHLNLNHLRHIDTGAATVILRTAEKLPPQRRMVVVCGTPVEQTLTKAGATEVAHLQLLVRPA